MRIASFVLFAALLAGCSAVSSSAGSGLVGTSWVLDRIVTAEGPTTARGTGAETITFEADGRIALASCNACTGTYRLSGSTLTLGEGVACTRRACLGDAIELERALAGPVEVRRDGEFLVLETGEGATRLVFLPAPAIAD